MDVREVAAPGISSRRTTCAIAPTAAATSSGKLIELGRFHHRSVHEGGWKVRVDDAGEVVVTNPTGNVIPTIHMPRTSADALVDLDSGVGLTIEPTTITPKWYGDPLDLGHITTALWCADQHARAQHAERRVT